MSRTVEDGRSDGADGDDKIVLEAQERFKRCETWEAYARRLFVEDRKFCNADSDNQYQWPNAIRDNRGERPTLTVNKTRQHCLQIVNDGRQNKSGVTIRPVGEQASYDSAQVLQGVINHIEYTSNAQAVYDTARVFQVEAGIGYWRIATDYADDDSFDQEIYIRPINDPLSVYLDPDINEFDGSDARFGFVFDDVARDEFDAKYPQLKDQVPRDTRDGSKGWIDKDHVRVAEYYRRVEIPDALIAMTGPDGERQFVKKSDIGEAMYKAVLSDPSVKTRPLTRYKVEWYKLAGDRILERGEWPGCEIPIVRLVGEEVVIEGLLDRKGHTRALKDPQRILNYWTSSAVEHVALQSKTPYVGPMAAFEGLETYWDTANRVNHAWLPYNAYDDASRPVPAPQRQEPPNMAPAFIQGREMAALDMQWVSGQYQAEMGEPSNERSGKAINARQRQSENSTYHFVDHEAQAIRRTGRILVDLIPKVYDTKRVLRILSDDGTEREVTIDPKAQQAYQKLADDTRKVQEIFNPNLGKYEVMADTGPDYATLRMEAFNALMELAGQAPQLISVIGDLIFRSADFPLADEAAQRLRRMVPAQALTDGPDPQVQHLEAQMQASQKLLEEMADKLRQAESKARTVAEQKDIDAFKALTARLEVVLKHYAIPASAEHQLASDLVTQAHQSQLGMIEQANAAALSDQQQTDDQGQPQGGAEQAA